MFNIRIFGDDVFNEKLDVMGARVTNPRPAIRIVANYLMAQTAKRFEEQGPGWAPLSRDWELRKAAAGLDPRILRQKKAGPTLFRSVTRYRAPGQILHITTDGLEFGSDLPYAATQQFGNPAHNIPQRKYLKITVADRLVIQNIFAGYFMAPFKASGKTRGVPAFEGARVARGPGGRFIRLEE